MASTYSSNLRLELIATGEKSGTWGDVTNTNLGTLLEEAIGGYVAVTVTDGADTVLTTNNGTADQARNMTLNLTGTLTAARNVIVPAIEKIYVIRNSTSGGFAVTVKVSGQTGVSVANGTTVLVFVDGTDVRQASSQISASNVGVIGAGSASAPSLTTIGDTNTGLWFPAADTLAVSTGGTERLRINSSGNVGIGMAPSYPLDVAGLIRLSGALTLSSSTFAYSYDGGTLGQVRSGVLLDGANQIATIYTAQNERVRVDASGNVGIGGTSSGEKLHVYGTIKSGGTDASVMAQCSTGSAVVAIQSASRYWRWITSPADTGALRLNDETAGVERMRIDYNGNVGIGVTSVNGRFHVRGPSGASIIYADNTGGQYTEIAWGNNGTFKATAYWDQTNTRFFFGTYVNAPVLFAINGSEQMRLDTSGNLGIGLTPSGYRLQTFQTGGSNISANFRTDQTASYVSFRDTGNASDTSIRCGSNANSFVVIANGSERTRVQSDGIYLVGKSSGDLGAVGCELRPDGIVSSTQTASTNSDSSYYLYSTGAAGYRFYVGLGGTVFAVSTTISAVSDQRLKENIRDLDVGLAAINQLKPRKFDWKPGKGQDIKNARGFIAQEFEQVFPDLIDVWKDPVPEGEEPYKAVRADLIPVLVKAVQELSAKNDELAARIAILEAV